jgi:hypothetical protein
MLRFHRFFAPRVLAVPASRARCPLALARVRTASLLNDRAQGFSRAENPRPTSLLTPAVGSVKKLGTACREVTPRLRTRDSLQERTRGSEIKPESARSSLEAAQRSQR